MKMKFLSIMTPGVLLLTTVLLSGCVMPAPARADASSSTVAGQSRSVILVPVLILPPTENDPPERDQGPALKPVPPEQFIADPQTQPARAPVRL